MTISHIADDDIDFGVKAFPTRFDDDSDDGETVLDRVDRKKREVEGELSASRIWSRGKKIIVQAVIGFVIVVGLAFAIRPPILQRSRRRGEPPVEQPLSLMRVLGAGALGSAAAMGLRFVL